MMRKFMTPVLALATLIALSGCWSAETTDAPAAGDATSSTKKASPTAVSTALGYMPEGAMVGMSIPPIADLEAKYWGLIEGSADAYLKIQGEGAEDPVAAMKVMAADALAEMSFEDEEPAESFAEFLGGDGIDTSRSMAIFGRINSYPPAENWEGEDTELALYVPLADSARFREALDALMKELEGSMMEGGETPGGKEIIALMTDDFEAVAYITDAEAYVATDSAWIDSMIARAESPASLPYGPGSDIQPVAGEIAMVYDATHLRPLIEEAEKAEGFVSPEGIPRAVIEGEWSVATLRVEADGIDFNAVGHFVADSVYAQSTSADLDLLPLVQDEAAAVVAIRLDEAMRDATLEDMQGAAALNPMAAMAMAPATPWLSMLDDEIVLAATGMMGFQPIILGMAEVKDPEQALTMMKGLGLPMMDGGEYGGHQVNVSQLGFVQLHSTFVDKTLVLATDPELFHASIDGLAGGGGASGSKVLTGVPRDSQMIVAADVEAIEKAVAPMAGQAVDEAFAGGRASDVVKRFAFTQRFEGQDQHVSLALEGDPGLAMILSAMED